MLQCYKGISFSSNLQHLIYDLQACLLYKYVGKICIWAQVLYLFSTVQMSPSIIRKQSPLWETPETDADAQQNSQLSLGGGGVLLHGDANRKNFKK